MYFLDYFIIISIFLIKYVQMEEYCTIKEDQCNNEKEQSRYILYDVNPPEGFNLRRDVYIRFAVFAHNLHKSKSSHLKHFKLVLPPWPNLHHWRMKQSTYMHIPWSHFFDLSSLQKFAPVIEMHQFFDEIGIRYGEINIDEVYILQHFEDMFKSGKFEDKMEIAKCNKEFFVTFYNYDNMTSSNVRCLSFHGHATQLSKILEESSARTILFDHAEVALHDRFGDRIYWQARRSMRFNKDLIEIATEYRQKYLNSSNEKDNVHVSSNWMDDDKPEKNAVGGPYLAVHLRRRDFAWSRPHDVPNIESAAKQIQAILVELNLKIVFVATDASHNEFQDLKHHLEPDFKVHKFTPTKTVKQSINPGGIAIIDQIICSHARHFVGTHESTFSYRIQEEREILGFPVETTFNKLCGNESDGKCDGTSKWTIVY